MTVEWIQGLGRMEVIEPTMAKLEQAVVDAALNWFRWHGYIPNLAAAHYEVPLIAATRALIVARERGMGELSRLDLRGDYLLDRYQQCARRIWQLFPEDPLGDDPAHCWIERLEAILDRGLLAPSLPPRNTSHELKEG